MNNKTIWDLQNWLVKPEEFLNPPVPKTTITDENDGLLIALQAIINESENAWPLGIVDQVKAMQDFMVDVKRTVRLYRNKQQKSSSVIL